MFASWGYITKALNCVHVFLNSSTRLGRPGVDSHVRHETDAAVVQIVFLMNEGALVTATADDSLHLWNFRQKRPEVVHSLKFQRERLARRCAVVYWRCGVEGEVASSSVSRLPSAAAHPLVTSRGYPLAHLGNNMESLGLHYIRIDESRSPCQSEVDFLCEQRHLQRRVNSWRVQTRINLRINLPCLCDPHRIDSNQPLMAYCLDVLVEGKILGSRHRHANDTNLHEKVSLAVFFNRRLGRGLLTYMKKSYENRLRKSVTFTASSRDLKVKPISYNSKWKSRRSHHRSKFTTQYALRNALCIMYRAQDCHTFYIHCPLDATPGLETNGGRRNGLTLANGSYLMSIKWLYVGSERGNIHVVNIESFVLSGYVINWNKAIEVGDKTAPDHREASDLSSHFFLQPTVNAQVDKVECVRALGGIRTMTSRLADPPRHNSPDGSRVSYGTYVIIWSQGQEAQQQILSQNNDWKDS
ncbi:Syntaxin-binding protein 5 [Homalodisca vitripennis]|nr:Syntaxin-binding protein 5 [Homalodisca vitripennis]